MTCLPKSPEVLQLLPPRGWKRGKSAEINLLIAYVKVLQAIMEADKALAEIPAESFVPKLAETAAQEQVAPKDKKSKFVPLELDAPPFQTI
eukprot:9303588-Karenia_brevis.AAC.1